MYCLLLCFQTGSASAPRQRERSYGGRRGKIEAFNKFRHLKQFKLEHCLRLSFGIAPCLWTVSINKHVIHGTDGTGFSQKLYSVAPYHYLSKVHLTSKIRHSDYKVTRIYLKDAQVLEVLQPPHIRKCILKFAEQERGRLYGQQNAAHPQVCSRQHVRNGGRQMYLFKYMLYVR